MTEASEAQAFLRGDEPALADPWRMKDMVPAIDRSQRAIADREPIVVYGDYDADGVTATALLVRFLAEAGADVRGYIPSRFEEGYGLNPGAIRQLAQEGARLIITVDCGVRSFAEADLCRELGIDLIITDHHQPLEGVPRATAAINPRQAGDDYPDKNLAGVGLAYRFAQAMRDRLAGYHGPIPSLDDALELVAVGTVADMAALTGENRGLVRGGLARMNAGGPHNPGLRALAKVAKVAAGLVRGHTIGFVLGPRLNAAGRLETARAALDMLLQQDPQVAFELAQQLDTWNRRRQEETRGTFEHARDSVLRLPVELPADAGPYFLLAADSSYNSGIIGLAAARLTEQFYRPSAVVSIEGDQARGSARSIPSFHITRALDECRELLIRHGGHAAAAGFTLAAGNVEELGRRLESLAGEALARENLRPALAVDTEVRLTELAGLNAVLPALEPCGMGNPVPVLVARGLSVREKRRVGGDGSHLKLWVEQDGRRMSAIAFRWGEAYDVLPARIDAAFNLTLNEYLGERRDELQIVDLAPAGARTNP
jgi:single-stranded-DNA-specific exonuclease